MLLRARIRRDPFLPRHFSSSHHPPPAPPEPASADPAPRSHFADIRDRLRCPASADAPRDAPPLDELRRKLRNFVTSNPSTSSASSSPGAPSFLDAFTTAPSSPPAPNRSSPFATRTPLDFSALRDSLNKHGSVVGGLPAPGARKIDLKSSLSLRRGKAGPEAALGRDLGAEGPEFLRQYSYDDLGKRLGDLRPAGAGKKDGKEWFSLEELSARLGRLREMDKEERERAPAASLGIGTLRQVLKSRALQTNDQKMAGGAPSMAALMGFVGQTVQGKPQEELVERYFHPDHMSSAEKMTLELKRVRDQFKMSENDCGSARVQVAQLTTKIKHLSATLHKKDKHSRKGLQEMVQRRKKYLKYLRRTDWDSYCLVLKSLGLRDVPEYKAPDYKSNSKSNTKSKTEKKSKRKMNA